MPDRRVSSSRTVTVSCTDSSTASSGGGDAVGSDGRYVGLWLTTFFSEMSPGQHVPRAVFVDFERKCLVTWARGPVAICGIRGR
jgi:hypothetical protein